MRDAVPALRRLDHGAAVSVGTAVRLVAQHCGHLGIDLDEMAAALAAVQR